MVTNLYVTVTEVKVKVTNDKVTLTNIKVTDVKEYDTSLVKSNMYSATVTALQERKSDSDKCQGDNDS